MLLVWKMLSGGSTHFAFAQRANWRRKRIEMLLGCCCRGFWVCVCGVGEPHCASSFFFFSLLFSFAWHTVHQASLQRTMDTNLKSPNCNNNQRRRPHQQWLNGDSECVPETLKMGKFSRWRHTVQQVISIKKHFLGDNPNHADTQSRAREREREGLLFLLVSQWRIKRWCTHTQTRTVDTHTLTSLDQKRRERNSVVAHKSAKTHSLTRRDTLKVKWNEENDTNKQMMKMTLSSLFFFSFSRNYYSFSSFVVWGIIVWRRRRRNVTQQNTRSLLRSDEDATKERVSAMAAQPSGFKPRPFKPYSRHLTPVCLFFSLFCYSVSLIF